jgi:hypothetical protein
MPSCSTCALPISVGSSLCPACEGTTKKRRKSLLIGAALVFAPGLFYLLWVGLLGLDFVANRAPLFGIDERMVYMECCFGGVIVEIVALWFLNRNVRWRFDLLTIGTALLAILSILQVLFMFVVLVGVAMGGAG